MQSINTPNAGCLLDAAACTCERAKNLKVVNWILTFWRGANGTNLTKELGICSEELGARVSCETEERLQGNWEAGGRFLLGPNETLCGIARGLAHVEDHVRDGTGERVHKTQATLRDGDVRDEERIQFQGVIDFETLLP